MIVYLIYNFVVINWIDYFKKLLKCQSYYNTSSIKTVLFFIYKQVQKKKLWKVLLCKILKILVISNIIKILETKKKKFVGKFL